MRAIFLLIFLLSAAHQFDFGAFAVDLLTKKCLRGQGKWSGFLRQMLSEGWSQP
jgi:hypothetical protein